MELLYCFGTMVSKINESRMIFVKSKKLETEEISPDTFFGLPKTLQFKKFENNITGKLSENRRTDRFMIFHSIFEF
jgi:hypothetical protein